MSCFYAVSMRPVLSSGKARHSECRVTDPGDVGRGNLGAKACQAAPPSIHLWDPFHEESSTSTSEGEITCSGMA